MRASRLPYAEFAGEVTTSRTEALLGGNVFVGEGFGFREDDRHRPIEMRARRGVDHVPDEQLAGDTVASGTPNRSQDFERSRSGEPDDRDGADSGAVAGATIVLGRYIGWLG